MPIPMAALRVLGAESADSSIRRAVLAWASRHRGIDRRVRPASAAQFYGRAGPDLSTRPRSTLIDAGGRA
jgi:hypothetical protein